MLIVLSFIQNANQKENSVNINTKSPSFENVTTFQLGENLQNYLIVNNFTFWVNYKEKSRKERSCIQDN